MVVPFNFATEDVRTGSARLAYEHRRQAGRCRALSTFLYTGAVIGFFLSGWLGAVAHLLPGPSFGRTVASIVVLSLAVFISLSSRRSLRHASWHERSSEGMLQYKNLAAQLVDEKASLSSLSTQLHLMPTYPR
jgi:hypothetical protein